MLHSVDGIEWDIKRLTRSQLRELRKSGLDMVTKTSKILMRGEEEGFALPFDAEEMDLMLDVAFPDKQDALENLSIMGRMELVQVLFSETLGAKATEVKN